jgi:hypothetical protein
VTHGRRRHPRWFAAFARAGAGMHRAIAAAMLRARVVPLLVALAVASCGGDDSPADRRRPHLSWGVIESGLARGLMPWRVPRAHVVRRVDDFHDLPDIHVLSPSEPTVGAVEDLQERVDRLCACRDAACARRERNLYQLARGLLQPRRGSSFVAQLDTLDERATACAAAAP